MSRQISIVDYPGGQRRRVTNDVSDYFQVTVSSGDEAIAAVRRNLLSDLWLTDAAGGEARPLTTYRNTENSPLGAVACSNGSIVFAAPRDQTFQLWSTTAGGGDAKPLTGGSVLAFAPRCLPDGVAYNHFEPDGRAQVWRVDFDGSNAKSLTPDFAAQIVDVAGNGALATVVRMDDQSLWAVPLRGGRRAA